MGNAIANELIQLWINLISNSSDAMKGKGKISIHSQSFSNLVSIELQDNGPGIPEDVKQNLFEPNITTKSNTSRYGLGLGLTICRQIVEYHHGHISTLPSQQGALFRITLPIKQGARHE